MKNRIMLICIAFILLCTACSKEQQYEFPMTKETLEKAIADHNLEWTIDNVDYGKDKKNSYPVFSIKGDDNIGYGILTNTYEDSKILNLTIYFNPEFSKEQINEYYKKDLKKFFDFGCDLYGDSRKIKKCLKDFYKYYNKGDGNFEGGLYWTKRVGDHVLWIDMQPMLGAEKRGNSICVLIITSDKAYENSFLPSNKNSLINTAKSENFEIDYSTVAGMKEFVLPVKEEDFYGKHFMVDGHLEDVKEIKTVPESLKNTRSSRWLLKANRDRYMMAKLVDDTGSIDVFLQTTPLNDNELGMEREHNVVLFYYNNEPFYVIRFSALEK